MKAIIISTCNKVKDEKVRELTNRAIRSCVKHGVNYEVFDAILPDEKDANWPRTWGSIAPGWLEAIKGKYTRKYPDIDWMRMSELKATVSVSHYWARQRAGRDNTIIMEQDAFLIRSPDEYDAGRIHNLQHDKPWRYSCYVCNEDSRELWDNIHYTNGAYWCEDHSMFKGRLPAIMDNHEGRDPVSGGNAPFDSQIMKMVRE